MADKPQTIVRTLAIVNDARRRAGVRVARVEVVEAFEIGAAMVRELTLRGFVTHFLSFERLGKSPKRISRQLRELLSRPADPSAENPPQTVAGNEDSGPGSASPSPLWYQKEQDENFPVETVAENASGAGATAPA